MRICVARRRGIHGHLGVIRSHALRNCHEGSIGVLLGHHRSAHSVLRVHKLRATLIMPHVIGLGPAIVERRNRLSK